MQVAVFGHNFTVVSATEESCLTAELEFLHSHIALQSPRFGFPTILVEKKTVFFGMSLSLTKHIALRENNTLKRALISIVLTATRMQTISTF